MFIKTPQNFYFPDTKLKSKSGFLNLLKYRNHEVLNLGPILMQKFQCKRKTVLNSHLWLKKQMVSRQCQPNISLLTFSNFLSLCYLIILLLNYVIFLLNWGIELQKIHFVPNYVALQFLYNLTWAECGFFSCTLSVFSHALIEVSNLHTHSVSGV